MAVNVAEPARWLDLETLGPYQLSALVQLTAVQCSKVLGPVVGNLGRAHISIPTVEGQPLIEPFGAQSTFTNHFAMDVLGIEARLSQGQTKFRLPLSYVNDGTDYKCYDFTGPQSRKAFMAFVSAVVDDVFDHGGMCASLFLHTYLNQLAIWERLAQHDDESLKQLLLVLRYVLGMTQRCQFKGDLSISQKQRRLRVVNQYLSNVGVQLDLDARGVRAKMRRVPRVDVPMTVELLRQALGQ
eukprot:m.127048 g.127048  ORF g.127048 m.127048 type:complete len:241 (-) comp15791_c0_seq3:2854-3576(-)